MRRVIAVVALIATMWPHVMVMSCVGPAPSPRSHASSMVSEHHEHAGPECPALMVCTATMIRSAVTSAPLPPGGSEARTTPRSTLLPAAAVLTDEPPPPRRSA